MQSIANELGTAIEGHRKELQGDHDKLITVIDDIFLPHFDIDYASILVLGQHARTPRREQRERFAKAFYNSITHRYAEGLLNYSRGRVKVLPFSGDLNDKRTVVRTQVMLDDGKSVSVDYAFRKSRSGDWKAYDVIIEGISYITNYRNQVDAEIRKDGIDKLISNLETEWRQGAGHVGEGRRTGQGVEVTSAGLPLSTRARRTPSGCPARSRSIPPQRRWPKPRRRCRTRPRQWLDLAASGSRQRRARRVLALLAHAPNAGQDARRAPTRRKACRPWRASQRSVEGLLPVGACAFCGAIIAIACLPARCPASPLKRLVLPESDKKGHSALFSVLRGGAGQACPAAFPLVLLVEQLVGSKLLSFRPCICSMTSAGGLPS